MALRFKLFILTLLLSLNAFSQSDTSKVKKDSCSITLSCDVAKRVAVDLVRGDSARAELEATQQLVGLLNQKIDKQDSLNTTYAYQIINLNKQVVLYQEKEFEYTNIITTLEGDNRKQKRVIKVLGVAVGVLFTSTLTLILAH